MGLYGGNVNTDENIDFSINQESVNELTESFLYDTVSRMDDESRREFIQSEACSVLVEAGKFKKNTIVRLNKTDDLSRRTTMAAIQLAKENNDPLYEKLALNRVKERELLGKINSKYEHKASRLAKIAQTDFIKKLRGTFNFKINTNK